MIYLAAWEKPLPVACKTAWAYLQAKTQADRLAASNPDKVSNDPNDAARAAFEGSFQRDGERKESAYLALAFETYDEIELEMPALAELLYGDMAQHVQTASVEGAAA